ncbi:hypothetical protein MAR_026915 [Mya arenaria]|uniref:Uncharacterized protein n=1 Tax=Mya arenaria TaxID=6604 RepID=A0ABY7ESA7_MYAAR|nr:hypothetical protein MAR_026915 [Mya arenaria]
MFKLMISWCCIIVVCKGNVFDNLLDEFWQWRMRNNPEFASNVGNSNYTDLLEDYSIAAIDTRKEWLEDFLTRVKSSVQRNSLDAGDSVTYGPMNPISILEGIQITYGSRAELIDQIITRMKKSLEMKTTYHSVSISSVPADLDKMLVFEGNITGFPMYEPFRSKLDEKEPSSTVRAMIRAKAEQNIGYLLGQVRTLKDFISSTYIPNVRTTLGVLGLPRGKEYYRACLKWQLSTDITPQEIHDLGLERVNITYMEMENITRKAGFNGTVQEYFAQIKADDSNYERDPMFKDIKKERVDPVLHNLFEDIPPNITHMKLKMEIPALLSHETDPGHHLQDAYALTSPSIPIFRRATDFTNWNKEQAVNYMLKYTTGSRETLEREVDRYSTWPGQATSWSLRYQEVPQRDSQEWRHAPLHHGETRETVHPGYESSAQSSGGHPGLPGSGRRSSTNT